MERLCLQADPGRIAFVGWGPTSDEDVGSGPPSRYAMACNDTPKDLSKGMTFKMILSHGWSMGWFMIGLIRLWPMVFFCLYLF